MTASDWYETICKSCEEPPVYFRGQKLPGFPSETVQVNTTGQAGRDSLSEAAMFHEDCIETFRELGNPLTPEKMLLDFGAGWGRITRFFLRELPPENLHGIDIIEDYVNICRETFESPNFTLCDPWPPTRLADESFTHVTGYSVFSHLSEKACHTWMQEFYRILKPGGIVAVTTRGRSFLDYCESLRGSSSKYQQALATMFDSFDDARARYDAGEFLHSNSHGVTGVAAMNSTFYGESFIPEAYARTAYAPQFTLEKFLLDPSRHIHPVMFFRKAN